ncbi:MAG: exodeoxyribonuclease VII large subunit [SAR324 cluster bacterium]|nr:exodeoxyribonuclease VII large subunit [SAR324 cluster bacterium]
MSDIPFEVDLSKPPSEQKDGGEGPDSVLRPEGAQRKSWTVSQLTRRIRQLLEGELPQVMVEGEVSNAKQAASGHLYFNLKDEGAQIRCVMFRNAAQGLRFTVVDGLQVLLRGRLSVYEVRGEYQIQVLTLEPQGTGALQLAFEQLKKKLEGEGLFAAEAKQPPPFLPRRIGIVTSPTGAAIRDMLQVLERRFPGLPVLLHPAAVQGAQAAPEIAEGIRTLNRMAAAQNIDVIIVGRGGGSVEDLWAFNEEEVARAIFASTVPVISAVGHEVDFTIADFVADLRAPTPSAAAELAVPNRAHLLATLSALRAQLINRITDELELARERWSSLRARLGSPEGAIQQVVQRVDDLRERSEQSLRRILELYNERLGQASARLRVARPDRLHRLHRAALRGLEGQLGPALRRYLRRMREKLAAQVELLESLSPLTVMKRGYGAVQDSTGKLLRSVHGVKAGDALKVRLQDGSLDAQVNTVNEDPPADN